MAIVLSKRVRALAASPASRSFRPSSVSRNEAARCGVTPGVILARRELSSGNAGETVGSGVVWLSPMPACREDSLVSLPAGGGVGDCVLISCSRIFPSWGTGLRLVSGGSGGGGAGIGAVLCGVRRAGVVLLLGGKGAR